MTEYGKSSQFLSLAAAIMLSADRAQREKHLPPLAPKPPLPKQPSRHTGTKAAARRRRQIQRGMLPCPYCGVRCRAACESYETSHGTTQE